MTTSDAALLAAITTLEAAGYTVLAPPSSARTYAMRLALNERRALPCQCRLCVASREGMI
jgi:hypothetical protein